MREYSRAYRIYAVALFAAVYFFYLVDRSAINVSQELIKREFGLSDTQLGLLTGTLFGLSYAVAGLPIGWAVDRFSRKKLLAGVVAVWSGLTAASGFATSFLQLAITRIGVGAAESGGSPACLSILTDMFPPEKRGRVASLFYSGAAVGGIVSFLLGGWIAKEYGWRAVFLAFGLPGLLIALLVLLTIREPQRSQPPPARGEASLLAGAWKTMREPGLGALYLATAVYMLSVAGVGTWTVSYFMRSFGLDIATVGLLMGLGSGVMGVIGQMGVGFVYDWARRFGDRGPLLVVAVGSAIHVAGGLVVLLSSNLAVAIAGLCIFGMTTSIQAGPTNAAISELARPAMRGTAFALYAVISNVVGSGLGPVAVGALSDGLGGDADALRTAMISVLLTQLLASWLYARAATQYARLRAG